MTLGFGQPVYALPFDRQTEVRANAIQRLICKEGPPLLLALLLKHFAMFLRSATTASKSSIQPNFPIFAHDEQNGTAWWFRRCDPA